MERLTRQTFAFSGVLVLLAAFVHLTPKPIRDGISQELFETKVPETVDGRRFVGQYDMGEETINLLKPSGIMARKFEYKGYLMDAVIIASRSKDSFHDPNICFSAQGWSIEMRNPQIIQTEKRKDLPVMFITLRHEKSPIQVAAYTYQGPGDKFYNNTNRLKLAFLQEELFLGNDIDGVFYRFMIDRGPEASVEARTEVLQEFIAKYMDEAATRSEGFL
jgi:hypothetical protein